MGGKSVRLTGTADTEAFEFQSIYGLEVVVIPTHRPMVRKDHSDFVYLTAKDKAFNGSVERAIKSGGLSAGLSVAELQLAARPARASSATAQGVEKRKVFILKRVKKKGKTKEKRTPYIIHAMFKAKNRKSVPIGNK